MAGAFVCRHQEGSWNGVSSGQFGEQTAIRIDKGGLKGMTLSPDNGSRMDRFISSHRLHLRYYGKHISRSADRKRTQTESVNHVTREKDRKGG